MIVVPITHCLQCKCVGTNWFPKEYTEAEIEEIKSEQLKEGYKLIVMTVDDFRAYKDTMPSYCYCNCDM